MVRRLVAGALIALACMAVSPELYARSGETEAVTLLKNGDFADQLLKDIRAARRSIRCSYFLFKTGNSRGNLPGRVADELVLAAKRGVQVTVILEQSGDDRDDLNRQNRQTANLLQRGGVRVSFDSPETTTHVKAAVIDNHIVLLGSHNLTQAALRHNNELSLRLDSPALAAEITSYLEQL